MIYIQICAPLDRNGNPRRCFLVFDDDGDVLDAVEEKRELLKRHPESKGEVQISVPVKEYREWLRVGAARWSQWLAKHPEWYTRDARGTP